jgi:cyclohexanecarboxyl-CoA dehydrogenase
LARDQSRVLDRALMREMGQMGFIAPELPEPSAARAWAAWPPA